MRRAHIRFLTLAVSAALFASCGPIPKFLSKNIDRMSRSIGPIADSLRYPVFDANGVTIHWVGHASMIIQMHDKVIATDPNYANTIGLLARRVVAPALDPSALTSVDATIISHTHFDHFNFGSIDMLPRNGDLFIPLGAVEYTPEFGFRTIYEMTPWRAVEQEGLRITAVPVQHFGGRYGMDIAWQRDQGYTGYIIEYRRTTVFFGGDFGYHPTLYKEIGKRFSVDVALIPIAPIEPRDFMRPVHVDPAEALEAMEDLGARVMIPMHHSTYDLGLDPSLSFASEELDRLAKEKGVRDRVFILPIGGRWMSRDGKMTTVMGGE